MSFEEGLALNKESRVLYLFWMGAPGCAESRSSPWKTREVVDFRPAGDGAGNRTADCAAMQSWTLA